MGHKKNIVNQSKPNNSFCSVRIAFGVFLCFFSFPVHAQWTWMKGGGNNIAVNNTMVTGTMGVPSIANTPSLNYAAVQWNDAQGNLWIYGSNDVFNSVYYSYLWKYNPTTNMWTLIHGSPSPIPVYGTQGVPSATNSPGKFSHGAASWVDNNGDLWLLGGYKKDYMWRYSIVTNEWTWVSGGSLFAIPIYGVQNVLSNTNTPGYRCEVKSCWTDVSGNFWLMGGGQGSTSFSDVWMYDTGVFQWVWKGGVVQQFNYSPTYGVKGMPSLANDPGRRQIHNLWKDPSGAVYFFGGCNSTIYADLWKYDPVSNLFTWVSGDNTINNSQGNYGTRCVPSVDNFPPCRGENRCSVTDHCGNFWMFGGSLNPYTGYNCLNDLWKYKPSTNEWTWVSGNNTPNSSGNYGQMGVASPANMPPANFGGAAILNKGMYMFGGTGNTGGAGAENNNIWRYAPAPTAAFTYIQNVGVCGLKFSDQSTPECGGDLQYWHWDFGDSSGSTLQNPVHQYATIGTYTVTLIVSNCLAITDTFQQVISTTSNFSSTTSSSPSSCITATGTASVYVQGSAGYTYSWSPTGGMVSTATNLNAGIYVVTITDTSNHCFVNDTILVGQASSLAASIQSNSPAVCASPGTAVIVANGGSAPYTYSWSPVGGTSNTATLPAGNYTATITDNNNCTDTIHIQITTQTDSVKISIQSIDSTICDSPGSATVTANGGTAPYTYNWAPVGGSNNTAALPVGTYTATLTDAKGCKDSILVQVPYQTVTLDISTSSSLVSCAGKNDGTISVNVNNGVPPYSYVWTPAVGTTATLTGLPPGTYHLMVHDAGWCLTQTDITILESPAVQLQLALSPASICAGDSAIATASASGGSGSFNYTWPPNPQTGASVQVHPASSTTYTCVVKDTSGCTDTASVLLKVNPIPKADFGGSGKACATHPLEFSDLSTINPGAISSWTWDFGDGHTSDLQNPLHTYNTPGSYNVSLTVVSSAGCSNTSTQNAFVTAYLPPLSDFSFSDNNNGGFNFTDLSTGALQWSWNFGDGNFSALQNPSHDYSTTQSAIYSLVTLVVSDQQGLCTDSSTRQVILHEYTLYVPNSFSPNGDGLNDVFLPKGTGIKEWELILYDRWGMELFTSKDLNTGWDATFKGKKVQEDTYVYVIHATEFRGTQHQLSGIVNVVK